MKHTDLLGVHIEATTGAPLVLLREQEIALAVRVGAPVLVSDPFRHDWAHDEPPPDAAEGNESG